MTSTSIKGNTFVRSKNPDEAMKIGAFSKEMKHQKMDQLMNKLAKKYGIKPPHIIETGPVEEMFEYGVGFFSNRVSHEDLPDNIDDWFVNLDDNEYKFDGIQEEFFVTISVSEEDVATGQNQVWSYYNTLEECEKYIKSLMV